MSRIVETVAILCLLTVNAIAKDSAKPDADERPKTYQRLIPADVLRGN